MATRPLTALAGFVAAQAAMSLNPTNSLELYTIEGYMDRAPSQAKVVGRVELSESITRTRNLLVTACRSSRATYDDLELAHAARLHGKSGEVSRLLAAPAGAAVKVTFAVYTQPVTSLLIAQIVDQAA
jgi:hypothetical protein